MSLQWRWTIPVLAAGLMLAGAGTIHVQAQLPTDGPGMKFHSGQSVTPYFEGWVENPDGTFDLVFGYFNRNYEQEIAVPAGADNYVEPGGPDAGQPTYFLTRRNRNLFRVRVPADFGDREVVWTVTANGRTEKGYGNLNPELELLEHNIASGQFDQGIVEPNLPPSITVAAVQSARVGQAVTLTASVTDDGLPERVYRRIHSGTKAELTVSWMQYGGPAKVRFDTSEPLPLENGQAVTTARFQEAGIYTLIASASDGALTRTTKVTVEVEAGPTPSAQP